MLEKGNRTDRTQMRMFDDSETHVDCIEWKNMPAYRSKDLEPYKTIKVHFNDDDEIRQFGELVGQELTSRTQSIWYPGIQDDKTAHLRWVSRQRISIKYPIYVISKGRWKSRLTSKALDAMGVDYFIVIEPQEYEQYAAEVEPHKILTLPFSNLGQGSIPARNWVWEHSLENGHKRHWILDDNIRDFARLHDNRKIRFADGGFFQAIEQFVDRFENVALAGPNYWHFVKRKVGNNPPYRLNTRIYSAILIDNSLEYRWRGRYNEDTDLSIRCLKAGLCTVLFNTFLQTKMTSMTMKGGNSDELYRGDGRRDMAESLKAQHPDIVNVTYRFKRIHHHVDYSGFKRNALVHVSEPPSETQVEFDMIEIKR